MNDAMRSATTFAIGMLLLCAVAIPVHATTITVTNTNDSGPGSLRQALADANDGDTITFAVTGEIQLTSGELVIDNSITISGPGADSLTLLGDFQTRILHVTPGLTVTISGLTIRYGGAQFDVGGGILNDHAIVAILNSTVSGNYASYAGGGIYNDAYKGGSATLTIMNSIVSNNSAGFSDVGTSAGEGGGIYNGAGTLMITNSSVSGNEAGALDPPAGFGGGISNYGTLTIADSTIDDNHCYLAGGGISSSGTLTITSSTVSGNYVDGQYEGQPVGHGGGISAVLTFTNSTLSNNSANLSDGGIEGGGAITNSTISGNGAAICGGVCGGFEIGNTVLNANALGNIDGTVTSLGYNISSDDGGGLLNGPGDQINTDPMLGPLQDNGGPTLTYALLPGSPAIDAGDPNFIPPPFYDQRGSPFVRVFNGRIDIGSFEVQPPRGPRPTPRPRPTPAPRP